MFIKKLINDGIRLRPINISMIFMSVLISLVLLYESFASASMYSAMNKNMVDYLSWQNNAHELIAASDYLTQEVQLFTVTRKRVHLDNYFTESHNNRRREKALQGLPDSTKETDAYHKFKEGLDDSLLLAEDEYFSLALMCDALDVKYIPVPIRDYVIDDAIKALPAEEKIILAQERVHSEDYYGKKERLREKIYGSLTELEQIVNLQQKEASEKMERQFVVVRTLIILFAIANILSFYMISVLGIRPIIRGVKNIKDDSPIPVEGASEFQYLAKAYNEMYDSYRKSIAHLNYDVAHDKLTGLYNRDGYDAIRNEIDLSNAALLLIDGDDFKSINDNYGHDVGDKVLIKIAESLIDNFRSEDFICRIGGDEFVVFMMGSRSQNRKLIINKVEKINKVLADTSDGLPPTSVSVGVVFGKDERDPDTMFKCADQALYKRKEEGRAGVSFYND